MKGKTNFQQGPSANDVEFARNPYPSKYDDLIDAASRMRHKETLLVDLEEGDTVESRRLCVRQALNRYLPEEVREIKRFEVRKSTDGRIVVVCIHLSRE